MLPEGSICEDPSCARWQFTSPSRETSQAGEIRTCGENDQAIEVGHDGEGGEREHERRASEGGEVSRGDPELLTGRAVKRERLESGPVRTTQNRLEHRDGLAPGLVRWCEAEILQPHQMRAVDCMPTHHTRRDVDPHPADRLQPEGEWKRR